MKHIKTVLIIAIANLFTQTAWSYIGIISSQSNKIPSEFSLKDKKNACCSHALREEKNIYKQYQFQTIIEKSFGEVLQEILPNWEVVVVPSDAAKKILSIKISIIHKEQKDMLQFLASPEWIITELLKEINKENNEDGLYRPTFSPSKKTVYIIKKE